MQHPLSVEHAINILSNITVTVKTKLGQNS